MSVHSTDAFGHTTELVGTEIWRFCQHVQFYFAERRGLYGFSCWKCHHENAEENSAAYERLSRAVYRFLHALEYQNINYRLEWYLLCCFYSRIGNFCKTFWKRRERLFQKMFASIRKQHIEFRKLVRKKLNKIALANATCFHWDLENHVKARQMNENWITHRQMLAATLSTPVVLLLMSEFCIFAFAVIFPVLTHSFSIASPDAQILARKTLFQQQYLKTPFWMNDA